MDKSQNLSLLKEARSKKKKKTTYHMIDLQKILGNAN